MHVLGRCQVNGAAGLFALGAVGAGPSHQPRVQAQVEDKLE